MLRCKLDCFLGVKIGERHLSNSACEPFENKRHLEIERTAAGTIELSIRRDRTGDLTRIVNADRMFG
jgi:hypothetical protein